MRPALTSAVAIVATLISLSAQRGDPLPQEALALTNASLVNARTLLDPVLVISNGRIGLDRLSFGKP